MIDRIQAAAASRTALRIRGGGSKDFYGQSLQGEVLDTAALGGVRSYEPTELVVTVGAATPLAELEALLVERGQHLAFEPPDFGATATQGGATTCGGMVACGLSGPARASAGSVRDHVLGVKLINGRGELLNFGGQVIKNVAGYDVSRLMVGAMGTLGLLTEISLKVLPVAAAQATLEFDIDQAGALAQLHRWGGQPLPLNASSWLREESAPGAVGVLRVRLRGAAAAVESACAAMAREAAGKRLEESLAARHWQACRHQTHAFFAPPNESLALWRLSVAQTAPALDLPYAQLIEWHGGQRWLWAPLSAQSTLRAVATAAGGTATILRAERADATQAVDRFNPLPAALSQIHQRLKSEFDPAGIFNPQRLYPGW